MVKHIDAELLRAEIKRRIDATINIHHIPCHRREELEGLLSFIDHLQQEQPAVDLEKEFNDFLNNVEGVPRIWHSDEQIEWAKDIARHFYELGRRAER